MDHMIHYTLNTGHTRDSPRSEVADDTLAIVAGWLTPGTHALPMPGYRLVVADENDAGLIATIYSSLAPVVTIGVAESDWAAEQIWPAIEAMYCKITDQGPMASFDWQAPKRPEPTPWVAAVILGDTPPESMGMLGDLERCIAWAWLEQAGQ